MRSNYHKTNKAGTEQSLMQEHKAGYTTQGLGKKILPEGWRFF